MSNELIEKLREYADGEGSVQAYMADVMRQAADALEAKAAPVGEREAFEVAYAEIRGCLTADVVRQLRRGDDYAETKNERLNIAWRAYQAGAAHQRQQAWEVVMPPLMPSEPFTTIDRGSKNFKAGWNACAQEFARLNKGAGSHE